MKKLALIATTILAAMPCLAGLYIISNADFTNPDFTLTFNIQDISRPQTILTNESYQGGVTIKIDDGTILTTESKKLVQHQFTSVGVHKVRIYSNGYNPDFSMRGIPEITKVVFGQNTKIRTRFSGCTGIKTAVFPSRLGEFNVPMPEWFRNCTSLETVSMPRLRAFPTYMIYTFAGCNSLKEVSLPNITNLLTYAFENCTNLTTFSATNLLFVGNNSKNFSSCSNLMTVITPKLEVVPTYFLFQLPSLKNVDLSSAKELYPSAIRECPNLERLSLPSCTNIMSGGLSWNPNLTRLEVPLIDKATVQQNAWNVWWVRYPGCVIVCKDGEEYIVTQP